MHAASRLHWFSFVDSHGLDTVPLLLRQNDGARIPAPAIPAVLGQEVASAGASALAETPPARMQAAALHGRHPILLQLKSGSSAAARAGRRPIGTARAFSQCEEGAMGAYAGYSTSRPHYRHLPMRVSGATGQAIAHFKSSPRPALSSSSKQTLGPRTSVSTIGWPSTIFVPGHTSCTVLLARAPQRHWHQTQLERTGKDHSTAQEGFGVVAFRSATAEWPSYFQSRRHSLHSLRQQQLWLGSSFERRRDSEGNLDDPRQGGAHYLQGVEGRAFRCAELSPSSPGPSSAAARRQSSSRQDSDYPHLAQSGTHERAPQALVFTRHQRHHHPSPLHPVGCQYMGRSPQPRIGRLGLAASPPTVPLFGSSLSAHGGPIRLSVERSSTPLQFPLAGPTNRGGRLFAAAGSSLEGGRQLVPSSHRADRRPRGKAAAEWSSRNCGNPSLAVSLVASATHRDVLRGFRVSREFPAFSAAGQVRWSRTRQMERIGVPRALPSWMHLRNQQLMARQVLPAPTRQRLSRPAKPPRYSLAPPRSQPVVGREVQQRYADCLGHDAVGQLAVELLLQRNAKTTAETYHTGVNTFLTFCEDYGLEPFDATPHDIVRFIAWVGQQGTVHAANLQPYLSGINSYFRDHMQEPVALGRLVSQAKQSLATRQIDTKATLRRTFLPAEIAYKIYMFASDSLSGSSSPDVAQLRALCATVFSFLFFNRSGTTRKIYTRDLAVQQGVIYFYERHSKGKDALQDSDRTVYQVPHPHLAALLGAFLTLRSRLCHSLGASIPDLLFALPGESTAKWDSATQTSWLLTACSLVGASPPPGFTWSSHSLRSGAASAASAEGWSLEQIEHYGGWSVGSSALRKSYIDPTVRPCPGSRFFFGWLLRRGSTTPTRP